MKTNKILTVLFAFVLLFLSADLNAADMKSTLKDLLNSNQKLSEKTKSFVGGKLLTICSDKGIVDEVIKQNGKGVSLNDIKKIDGDWQKAEEPTPIIKEKLSNACAEKLKKLITNLPAVVEAFVMDNQGAVVGETNMTSDYWQGDEPKWSNSYNGGKGGIEVGDIKFDKSVNASIQQVSLPIFSSDGKVVGAVTFGIKVEKL